ncbi:XdhC family protein [Paenibacillus sepulcri]
MDNYSVLETIVHRDEPAVMATLIGVKGHAYRKAGASMILWQDGRTTGSLSPGCLESDLKERVHDLLAAGSCEIIDYNLNAGEDAVWGGSVGCGGSVRVLLEPVLAKLRGIMAAIYARVQSGGNVCLRRRFSGDALMYRLPGIPEDGAAIPFRSGIPESAEPFFDAVFKRPPRVIIFGAGDDSIPMVHLIRKIGFRVVVADWRAGLCTEKRFQDVQFASGNPESIIEKLHPGSGDYAVICSHQLQRDREMLELLLPHRLRYVGILGSRARIDQLSEGLAITSNVHSPVGLAIGAEGPEEIAVSIAAEIIAVKAGYDITVKKGAARNQSRRVVFGSWFQQKNGRDEAVARAVSRNNTR